jgi:hypothetical protein
MPIENHRDGLICTCTCPNYFHPFYKEKVKVKVKEKERKS